MPLSTVLIITNDCDSHADAVVLELKRRNVPVFRLHPQDFPHACSISIEMQDGEIAGEIATPLRRLAFKDIGAAWFRGPNRGGKGIESTKLGQLDNYVKKQSTEIFKTLYQSLQTFWVCDPYKLERADVKALQLIEASRVGLKTPHTLISNGHAKVTAFVEQLGDGECALKPLRAERVGDEREFRFPLTTTLPKGYPLDSVALAPNIFQPYIHKAAELRCVVIGQKIFTAKIDSQAQVCTSKDWRAGKCRLEPFALPEEVEGSLLRLMERFGINFASLDMILTPEGEFVFLELNPNGQWLWLEVELGLPLVASMADLLMSHLD